MTDNEIKKALECCSVHGLLECKKVSEEKRRCNLYVCFKQRCP